MKKTININLAGYPFIIDEDAYNMLKDYLDTIRYAFDTNDDTGEIASDIESRIAELLVNNEEGKIKIVTLSEVSEVIERIGRPSEFIDVEETIEVAETDSLKEDIDINPENPTPPPYQPNTTSKNPFVRKRIFRDPQNAMLGGVCAGLANYLHVDVTVIRLITVLLFFLSATTVAIVYIVLWIVVPEARTPLQRMKMMGEDTTVENIGKTVTENYQENTQDSAAQNKNGITGLLSSALSIFIKILIFLGLLIAIPLLIALSAGLIGCVIAVFVIGVAIVGGISDGDYGWFDSTLEGQLVFFILLAVIGGIITVGIPVWLFFRMLWSKKDNSKNQLPTKTRPSLVTVWLCGIALLSVFTVKAVKKGHQIDLQDWGQNHKNINALDSIDEGDIEKLKIDKHGITIESKEGKKIEIANGHVEIEGYDFEKEIDSKIDSLGNIINATVVDTDTLKIENLPVD